jgi:phage-related minor tail protein
LLKSIGGSGGGSGSANLFGNLFSAALSAFGGFRETGGPVARGRSYVVGERGRELFIPNSSGRIIDAAGTRAALSGGQVEVNVNVEPSPLFITTVQQSSAQAAQGVVRNVQRRRLPAAIGQGR